MSRECRTLTTGAIRHSSPPDRARWDRIAHGGRLLQTTSSPKNCLRINPFLQNWKPTKTHLLDDLRHISAIAKKYGLRLEVLAPERSIIREMPMWDHAQADRAKIRTLGGRSVATACLKNTHSLITVGDFKKFVLGASEPEHDKHSRACQCDRCTYLRLELGCSAPADCYAGEHPEDYEADSHQEARSLFSGHEDIEIFDRCITTTGTIADALRIFTGSEDVCNKLPSLATGNAAGIIEVATDGSCLQNGEAVATLIATRVADPAVPLLHITDSRTTLEAVTKCFRKYQDEGFINQKNPDLTRAIVAATLERKAHTAFLWVKGHNGHPGNENADVLAGRRARKLAPDPVDVTVPRQFLVTGAKLKPRWHTKERVDQVIKDLRDILSIHITPETLWKSLASSTISREARQWTWMTLHDAYMIGTHWLRPSMSDELRERAICKICGQTETMEHILFTCNARGREIIWKLLHETWTTAEGLPRAPSWGTIMGAACTGRKADGGRCTAALENCWAILAVESARLIWKLRSLLLGKKRKQHIRLVEGTWSPLLEEKSDLPARWVTD
ncbi:hypothetical protein BC628DRAFT_1340667 [Trametes gibbosa]|nr:hypothetical protein BC628DRAFT_1340667 [Trametes gibbosa]